MFGTLSSLATISRPSLFLPLTIFAPRPVRLLADRDHGVKALNIRRLFFHATRHGPLPATFLPEPFVPPSTFQRHPMTDRFAFPQQMHELQHVRVSTVYLPLVVARTGELFCRRGVWRLQLRVVPL